jgi:hypothetical protein
MGYGLSRIKEIKNVPAGVMDHPNRKKASISLLLYSLPLSPPPPLFSHFSCSALVHFDTTLPWNFPASAHVRVFSIASPYATSLYTSTRGKKRSIAFYFRLLRDDVYRENEICVFLSGLTPYCNVFSVSLSPAFLSRAKQGI